MWVRKIISEIIVIIIFNDGKVKIVIFVFFFEIIELSRIWNKKEYLKWF